MLNENQVRQHQEALHKLLKELAVSSNKLWEDSTKLNVYKNRLSNIYTGGFRHQYSKLLDVVNSVFDDDDKDITVFQENIKTLRQYLSEPLIGSIDNRLTARFDKLRDHLSLEISRRQTIHSQDEKMNELEERHDAITARANELEQKFQDISGRLSKAQIDFVAVLSIFACVVTAFSSGSSYIMSAINATSQNFTLEILLVVLLCGLIMMDILFMLIYFIGAIIGRTLGLRWWVALAANVVIAAAVVRVWYVLLS